MGKKERRRSDLGIKEPRARGGITQDAGENTSGGIGQGVTGTKPACNKRS